MVIRLNSRHRLLYVLLAFVFFMIALLVWSAMIDHKEMEAVSRYKSVTLYPNVYDRNGVQLLSDSGEFHENPLVKASTFHLIQDLSAKASDIEREECGWSLIDGYFWYHHSRRSTFRLSIDSHLSSEMYSILAENTSNSEISVVIVSNYETGELVAISEYPVPGSLDDAEEPPDGLWVNNAMQRYVPGSIFKIATLSAFLENENRAMPYNCDGDLGILAGTKSTTIYCPSPHGSQSLEQAFPNSCNCYFSKIGLILGEEKLIASMENFGFYEAIPLMETLDYSVEESRFDFSNELLIAEGAYGQGKSEISLFHMIELINAIANDGELHPLTLENNGSSNATTLMNESTAKKVKGLMRLAAQSYGYDDSLCGKTGTAELGNGMNNSFFLGFSTEQPYSFIILIHQSVHSGLSGAAGNLFAEMQPILDSYEWE